ncbi:MAG: hypothetical protein MUO53_10730 [Maribacter sp.]|nr:hypothetical protein [Maribacter sp.]
MVKNYVLTFIILTIVFPSYLQGQDIKIFRVSDFELHGNVKSCMVSTNYGKEEYDFDVEGRLTKSVTRYNDRDYDITYYKYKNGELVEKRLENYRDNVFDSGTSIANFYELDTIGDRKITEKIISYDKVFLDQYEYFFDSDSILKRLVRSNNNGNDETVIRYATYQDEKTKTIELNGEILESERTSTKKAKDGTINHLVLTKKFLEGEPNSAIEQVFNNKNELISSTSFSYNMNSQQFVPEESVVYTYNELGMLTKKAVTVNNHAETLEYIYQFDDGDSGNWIKQIVSPTNSFRTRKITYYPDDASLKEQ